MRSILSISIACTALMSSALLGQEAKPKGILGFANVTISPGFQMVANPFLTKDNTIGALLKNLPEGTIIFKLLEGTASTNAVAADLSALDPMIRLLPREIDAPVRLSRDDPNVIVRWNGILESATDVSGPFIPLPELASPLDLPMQEAQRFWRARKSLPTPTNFVMSTFEAGVWSDPSIALQPGEGAIILNPTPNVVTVSFAGEVLQGNLSNPIPEGLSMRSSIIPQMGGLTSKLALYLTPGDHVFKWVGDKFAEYTFASGNVWVPEEPQIRVAEAFFIYTFVPTTWDRGFRPLSQGPGELVAPETRVER